MPTTAYAYTEADRPQLREFMLTMRHSGAPGCWHVGDLVWTVFFLGTIGADLHADLRLWKDAAGRVLGFAWFDARERYVLIQALPGAEKWKIEKEMLAWAAGRCLASVTDGAAPTLKASAFAADPEQAAFLEALGFERQPGYVHFTQPLAGTLPAPAVEGFVVRTVAGDHELDERSAAHREAFQPSRVTEGQYSRLAQMPEYRRDLDVVAVAPNGTIAAFCLCWLDPVNQVGEFEPVGTRPAYRGKGLARAVLGEGLRRMRAGGMKTAFVCTQHDNAAAQALYRSAGFEITNSDFDYVRAKPDELIREGG